MNNSTLAQKIELQKVRIQEYQHRIDRTQERIDRNTELMKDLESNNTKLEVRIEGFQADIELAEREISLYEDAKTSEDDNK